jgi:hypothetical protein
MITTTARRGIRRTPQVARGNPRTGKDRPCVSLTLALSMISTR